MKMSIISVFTARKFWEVMARAFGDQIRLDRILTFVTLLGLKGGIMSGSNYWWWMIIK